MSLETFTVKSNGELVTIHAEKVYFDGPGLRFFKNDQLIAIFQSYDFWFQDVEIKDE